MHGSFGLIVALLKATFVVAAGISIAVVTSWAWLAFGNFNTRYATGFSETAFRTISEGATCDEVALRLGEPLEKLLRPEKQIWYYAEQADSRANYFLRNIHFDDSCRVSRVYAAIEFD